MTDLDKYTSLLRSWNVLYDVAHNNMTQRTQVSIVVPHHTERRTNVVGYSDFTTIVEFDPDGNFVNIGIWE